MGVSINALLCLSILISVIISTMRLKKTEPAFAPFILLLKFTLANAIIGASELNAGFVNTFSYNFNAPVEFLLITWQFKRWGLFRYRAWLYFLLQGGCVAAFIFECALTHRDHYYSYFIVGHGIVIVLMSISQINLLLASLSRDIARDPAFLICTAMLVYYTCSILIETLWMYGLSNSQAFRMNIQELLMYIRLLTNTLFVFATIWIPLKPNYIMRS